MKDLMVDKATKVGASMLGDRKTAAYSEPGFGFYGNPLSHKFMVLERCTLISYKVSAHSNQRTLCSTT